MARSRGFPSRQRRPRRNTSWVAAASGIVQRTSSGSTLFGFGGQAVVDGLTIMRTRGHLGIYLSAGAAALDGFDGAVGLAIVSENAFGVGITAVPTPITDEAWDGWFWFSHFSVKVPSANNFAGNASSIQIPVDSKAMRKIKNTDTIIAVLEATEVGGATVNMSLQTRMLVMEV